MLIKEMFIGENINFKKRCQRRIWIGGGVIFLGTLALIALAVFRFKLPVMYLEADGGDFINGFYTGIGFALIASGIITIVKNVRYLKNQSAGKKQEILETDERNRTIGLRTWAYAGYAMFVLLYLGILIGGFISAVVLKVLLVVLGVFGLTLLIFRMIFQRCM